MVQMAPGENAWKKLQSLLTQLRKVCQHPYLLPGSEPNFDGSTGAPPCHDQSQRNPASGMTLYRLPSLLHGIRVLFLLPWSPGCLRLCMALHGIDAATHHQLSTLHCPLIHISSG